MKHEQTLNQIFDLAPVEKKDLAISESHNLPMVQDVETEVEDDYQLARKTMRSLLQRGESVLDEISDIARSSEHPRSYEVAGQMMKTLSEVAKDLIDLQKQVKDVRVDKKETQTIQQQNNIVFAGSTDDLINLLSRNESKTINSQD